MSYKKPTARERKEHKMSIAHALEVKAERQKHAHLPQEVQDAAAFLSIRPAPRFGEEKVSGNANNVAPTIPPVPPTHRLFPEQFILLELVKVAMHTSDEDSPSAADALRQLPNLKQLTRDILEYHL